MAALLKITAKWPWRSSGNDMGSLTSAVWPTSTRWPLRKVFKSAANHSSVDTWISSEDLRPNVDGIAVPFSIRLQLTVEIFCVEVISFKQRLTWW